MSLPVTVFVHIYFCDVDVGRHSYVCMCFLVCCLCVSLPVYMCTHVCNIYVFCLCVCVYTHVCGAHAGDIPPQMRETRVPMLEAPLPLFLYCLPATCATCNSPKTNTNKHIHYTHIYRHQHTHSQKQTSRYPYYVLLYFLLVLVMEQKS